MLAFKSPTVVLVLAAVIIAAVPVAETADADDWVGKDKDYHLIAGFMVGASVTAYTNSPNKGVAAGLTIGVLKEVSDMKSGSDAVSIKDAVVTGLGALAGSYVTGLVVIPGAVWYRWEW